MLRIEISEHKQKSKQKQKTKKIKTQKKKLVKILNKRDFYFSCLGIDLATLLWIYYHIKDL